ncbi:hypothetical protein AAG747_02455 [Rapidithrix thailandica]|uniref:Tetratricopeptide repeat protein n=1 Tax=Rapidithrix thailandica TaxID=413964 RepID=A0AAW9RT20_9BACT
MTLSFHPDTSCGILLGAGNFSKEERFKPLPQVADKVERLANTMSARESIGIPANRILKQIDADNNILLKEHIAEIAEQAEDALFFYYTGHLLLRKGQVYLATHHTTWHQVHINGLALREVLELISEYTIKRTYILLDVTIHQTTTESGGVHEALKRFVTQMEQEFPGTAILSYPTGARIENPFTWKLVDLLEKGVEVKQKSLSIAQVLASIQGEWIVSSQTEQSGDKICHNTRYTQFCELLDKAESYFKTLELQEAQAYYQQANELFPGELDLHNKLSFIRHWQQGERCFQVGNYVEARASFEEALALFDMPAVKQKVNESIELIAQSLYREGRYTQAKFYFELLIKNAGNKAEYAESLKKCEDEIKFKSTVNHADQLYFEERYGEALNKYEEALQLHHDQTLLSRKQDCVKFLEKEEVLRARLIKEIQTKNTHGEQRNEMVDQEAVERLLQKQLTAEREAWEDQLWKQVEVKNQKALYELYLSLFPEGRHVEVARQKVVEQKATSENIKEVISEIEQTGTETAITSLSQEEGKEPETAKNGSFMTFDFDLDIPEPFRNKVRQQVVDEKEEEEPLVAPSPVSATSSEPAEETFLEEEELWRQAQLQDTIDAYKSYLANTQESTYLTDAFYMINKLSREEEGTFPVEEVEDPVFTNTQWESQEEEVEEALTFSFEEEQEGSIPEEPASTEKYEEPDDEEALWIQAIKENTLSSYLEYLNKSESRNHVDEAKQRIQEIKKISQQREEEEWTSVSGKDTAEAYKSYMKKYPLGSYYSKAMSRINELGAEV